MGTIKHKSSEKGAGNIITGRLRLDIMTHEQVISKAAFFMIRRHKNITQDISLILAATLFLVPNILQPIKELATVIIYIRGTVGALVSIPYRQRKEHFLPLA